MFCLCTLHHHIIVYQNYFILYHSLSHKWTRSLLYIGLRLNCTFLLNSLGRLIWLYPPPHPPSFPHPSPTWRCPGRWWTACCARTEVSAGRVHWAHWALQWRQPSFLCSQHSGRGSGISSLEWLQPLRPSPCIWQQCWACPCSDPRSLSGRECLASGRSRPGILS